MSELQGILDWIAANPIPSLIVALMLAISIPSVFLYILYRIIQNVNTDGQHISDAQRPLFSLLTESLNDVKVAIRESSQAQVNAMQGMSRDVTLAIITAQGDIDRHLTQQDKQIETEGKKIELVLSNVKEMQSEIALLKDKVSLCVQAGDLTPIKNDLDSLKHSLGVVVQWIEKQKEKTNETI